MLNCAETTNSRIPVSLSPVASLQHEQKTDPLPSSSDFDDYVPRRIGFYGYLVSPTLKDGYRAAFQAYADMEEQDECGPYRLLTGYEYAHLARRYLPAYVPASEKREWHRGFVAGWNACSFGCEGQAHAAE